MPPGPRSPAPAGSPDAADDDDELGDLPPGLGPGLGAAIPSGELPEGGGIPITAPARSTLPCGVSTIHEPGDPGPACGPTPPGTPSGPGVALGASSPLNTGLAAGGAPVSTGG